MATGGNFSSCLCGPGVSACESPTQPVATVGLCLADGTPIAVTVVRDCAGTVTGEGWIDLTTGAWSSGPPPAGTIACGDNRSVTTNGTFCDVLEDGTVAGLVLVEYQYAADGTIDAVRLVDAVTGTTYTPQGEVTTCPAGVEAPERDMLQLCDITDDESGAITSVPFLRDYARDESGAVVGHADYTLDGDPYTPSGTVGVCGPQAEPVEPCASTVTVLRLCDLNPDAPPDDEGKRCAIPFLRHLVYDCTGALAETRDTTTDGTTPYTPVEAVDCGSGGVPAMVEVPWEVVDIQPDPDSEAGRGLIYTLSPIDDPATVGRVTVTTTATANTACPGTPPSYNFRNPCTYTFSPDQALQDAATYVRCDLIDFDTFEPVTGLNPPPSRLGGTAYWDGTTVRPTESNGVGEMYYDGPPASWSYRVGNTGGGNSCSNLSFAAVSLRPEGCCAPCGSSDGGDGSGRTVQEVCVIANSAPTEVMTWTRVIEDGGATIYYLDQDGGRYDGTLPAGHQIVACPVEPEPCRNAMTLLLCDAQAEPEEPVPAEGAEPVQFLRTLVTDCITGGIISVTDTTLDGQPYTAAGEVSQCTATGSDAGECLHCETLTLCDVQPDEEESPGEGTEVPWTTVSVVEDPETAGQHTDFIFTISPQDDPSTVGTVHVNVSRAAGGACGDFDINDLIFSNTAQYHLTLDEVAQQVDFLRVDLLDFDGFEPVAILTGTPEPTRLGGTAVWNAGHDRIIPTEDNGTGELYWDNPPATIAYEIFNTGGGTSCSRLSFAGVTIVPPPPPPPAGTKTPFLRTICRACDGSALSVTDTTVDGTPYEVTGQVGQCEPAAECCPAPPPETRVDVETVVLCVQDDDGGILARVLAERVYDDQSGELIEQRLTGLDGGAYTLPDGAELADCGEGRRPGRDVELLPMCVLDDGTGTVVQRVLAEIRYDTDTGERLGVDYIDPVTWEPVPMPGGTHLGVCPPEESGPEAEVLQLCDLVDGQDPVPFLRHITYDSGGAVAVVTDTALDGLSPYAPSGTVGICRPEPGPEPYVTQMCRCDDTDGDGIADTDYVEVLEVAADGTLTSVGAYTADMSGPYAPVSPVPCPAAGSPGPDLAAEAVLLCDITAEGATSFLRHLRYNAAGEVITTSDTELDGTTPYTVTGEPGQCATAEGEAPECAVQHVIEACRCDDTDGDGTADTDYVELLGVDCSGGLTSLGTYTEDLTGPYDPVSPVDCAAAAGGAPPVTGVQARRVELAPGGSWDASSVSLLQSVTATAHGGTGTITTVDGASTLHAGESVAWSVQRDADAALTGPLAITAGTGTITITFTQGVSL